MFAYCQCHMHRLKPSVCVLKPDPLLFFFRLSEAPSDSGCNVMYHSADPNMIN